MQKDNNPRILFIHIPKCGGVSLRESVFDAAMQHDYSSNKILIPGKSHDLSYDEKYREIDDISEFSVVAGHYFPQGIESSDLSFTFLREPISRFISHYYFFCYNRPLPRFGSQKRLSEMNNTEIEKLTPLGNILTKWLCGSIGVKDRQPSVDQALDILFNKFTSFGLLSDMNKSIKKINYEFNGRFSLASPGILNRRKTLQEKEDKATINYLMHINSMDVTLYTEAKNIFDRFNL